MYNIRMLRTHINGNVINLIRNNNIFGYSYNSIYVLINSNVVASDLINKINKFI